MVESPLDIKIGSPRSWEQIPWHWQTTYWPATSWEYSSLLTNKSNETKKHRVTKLGISTRRAFCTYVRNRNNEIKMNLIYNKFMLLLFNTIPCSRFVLSETVYNMIVLDTWTTLDERDYKQVWSVLCGAVRNMIWERPP